jgi:adenylylsulfate kinase
LCADLGFSVVDRAENIRRIGETAKLLLDAGIITLTAFISPYQGDREKVRALLPYDFIEIYCQCALETCEARDIKGLYKKARAGEIKEFTGISAPYQAPVSPELIIETDRYTLAESVARVLGYLDNKQLLHALEG